MKPEYKRLMITDAVLFVLAGAAGLAWGRREALCLLFAAAVFSGLWLYELRHRKKSIDRLCEKLDRLLYADAPWEISQYQEGELSVLQDKVQKLTIRLREQASLLAQEKGFQEQMMTDISHQLKTPLTSMGLIVNRLRYEELAKEQRQRGLFELELLIQRVDSLVVTLLKMAKLDSGTAYVKSEPVNIKELIRYAVRPLEAAMDIHGISLEYQGDEQAQFTGDFDWSSEAVANLIKNSMEHMEAGGCIWISWRENAIYSEICIEDEGTGIARDELPYIFDRFYRGRDARHSGFGIGMSFARMIIGKQNGTIKADNRLQGGARFVIRFYKEGK